MRKYEKAGLGRGRPFRIKTQLVLEGGFLHDAAAQSNAGQAKAEQAAKAQGIGHRIAVTGILLCDQIPAHTAAFDIAMQPKATAYASPLKLFEYMALGRAIIAPDQLNLREVLTDGARIG